MNLKDITLEISRIPSVVVLGAYDKYIASGVTVGKQQAVSALALAVCDGVITLADIKSAPQLSPRSPAVTPVVDPLVQATANVASRAEGTALDALRLGYKVEGVVKELIDEVTNLAKRAPATLDTSTIQSQVTKAIADAFKPFAEAVNASGAQAVIGNMVSVTKIDCLPCVDVFGVDVRDMKGNPLFVDIYNAPNAPRIDPDFVWTEGILKHLILSQRTGENTFFGGEKGTGKSQTAEQFSARTGRFSRRISDIPKRLHRAHVSAIF